MKDQTILVIDDTISNLDILVEILDAYDVIEASNGADALEIVNDEDIDLIILDIVMPDMDGYEVCTILKENKATMHIPIIFITANTDMECIGKAFNVGGIDYISKPLNPKEITSRVSAHLALNQEQKNLESTKIKLLSENNVLINEIVDTQKELILSMGSIAEVRNIQTGNDVKRIAKYSKLLALHYGLSEEESSILEEASPMHDLGKVAIPDHILNQPGKLDIDECKIMQDHTVRGYEMIKDSKGALFQTAAIVAHEHHEKWDGSGYPRGLKGEEIHIYGRITALADVFDSLVSHKCYKTLWEDDDILSVIEGAKGKHFDPALVNIFFDNLEEIFEIRDTFSDILILD